MISRPAKGWVNTVKKDWFKRREIVKRKWNGININGASGNRNPGNVKLLKLYLAIENTLYLCIKDKINNEKSYRLYSCFY